MTVFHIDVGGPDTRAFDRMSWPSYVDVPRLHLDYSLDDSDDNLIEAWDATEEPVDLGSVVPQFQIGRAVQAAGFNVCLSGDGADELFGGYRRAKEYDSQYSDIFSELVHYHNPRIDKCMMASTVELRSPFLAPKVIQAAMFLPYEDRTSKQALKRAFDDIVPEEILAREKHPLKTDLVIAGGKSYQEQVIQHFLRKVDR
jgi:asparagine synthetase B (glutamine-hydrolysing)